MPINLSILFPLFLSYIPFSLIKTWSINISSYSRAMKNLDGSISKCKKIENDLQEPGRNIFNY